MKELWVRWSEIEDSDGNLMVLIGSAHYPKTIAREIAKQVLDLIGADGPGNLKARDRSKFNPRAKKEVRP